MLSAPWPFRRRSHKDEELALSIEFGLTAQLLDFVKGFTADTFKNYPLQDDPKENVDAETPSISSLNIDLCEWKERHAVLLLSKSREISQIRYALCPRVLKEQQFWRIYFLLVKNYVAPCSFLVFTRMQKKEASIGLSWAPEVPFSLTEKKGSSANSFSQPKASIWKADNELIDGLYVPPMDPKKVNKLIKKSIKDTAGKSWFDMPAPIITPELKKDLEILKLRNFIDPKKHFKKGESSKALPKYFQMGTVVESAYEFFSSRLTKKERKPTLADELLSDTAFQTYRKRKVKEVNESRRPGGISKWKNSGRSTWKRAKERRRG